MKNEVTENPQTARAFRAPVRLVISLVLLSGVSGVVSTPVYGQGGEAAAGSEVDELGLDSPAPDPLAESQKAPPPAAEIPAPPAVEISEGEPAAEDSVGAGMPPQPSTAGAVEDLPGLEVVDQAASTTNSPVPTELGGAVANAPQTEDSFDKMLEKKGKPENLTPDSVKEKIKQDDRSPFRPEKIRSLFFTYWQHEAIVDAKKSRGLARPPTEGELKALDKEPPKPGERDLTLDGIVFVSTEDWTIWLNGMRVTPSAIPKEVIDLRVFKEYIEVKWLDEYTNQVFPIRLRAHQRFNLDMRIFLPG